MFTSQKVNDLEQKFDSRINDIVNQINNTNFTTMESARTQERLLDQVGRNIATAEDVYRQTTQDYNTRFSTINNRLYTLNVNDETLNTKMNILEKTVNALPVKEQSERLSKIEGANILQGRSIDLLETNYINLENKVTNITNNYATNQSVKNIQNIINTEFNNTNNKINDFSSKTDKSIDTINTNINTLNASTQDFTTFMKTYKPTVDGLQVWQGSTNTTLSSLQGIPARVTNIENDYINTNKLTQKSQELINQINDIRTMITTTTVPTTYTKQQTTLAINDRLMNMEKTVSIINGLVTGKQLVTLDQLQTLFGVTTLQGTTNSLSILQETLTNKFAYYDKELGNRALVSKLTELENKYNAFVGDFNKFFKIKYNGNYPYAEFRDETIGPNGLKIVHEANPGNFSQYSDKDDMIITANEPSKRLIIANSKTPADGQTNGSMVFKDGNIGVGIDSKNPLHKLHVFESKGTWASRFENNNTATGKNTRVDLADGSTGMGLQVYNGSIVNFNINSDGDAYIKRNMRIGLESVPAIADTNALMIKGNPTGNMWAMKIDNNDSTKNPNSASTITAGSRDGSGMKINTIDADSKSYALWLNAQKTSSTGVTQDTSLFKANNDGKIEMQKTVFNDAGKNTIYGETTLDNNLTVNGTSKFINSVVFNNNIQSINGLFRINRLPANAYPFGPTGLYSDNIYSDGTIGIGSGGAINASMKNDGSVMVKKLCVNETECMDTYDLQSLKSLVSYNFATFPQARNIPNLIGLYTGENWDTINKIWRDISGSGNHCIENRSPNNIVKTILPNTNRTFIYGNVNAGIIFPAGILPAEYTLFYLAKYNGGSQGRIFNGYTKNWLSGFHDTRSGVAYHEGWITSYTNNHGTSWVLGTDQNTLYRSNKINKTISGGNASDRLSINTRYEFSDWAVACVLVYNRKLSLSEIQTVENEISSLYTGFGV